MDLSDLYADVIMDHHRNPRNFGSLAEKDKEVHLTNSSCGDEIYLEVKLEGGRISKIAFRGMGCAISVASASLMTELVSGATLERAKELSEEFFGMVRDGKESSKDLGDARVFEGVSKYPMRVKCATLAWHALEKVIE